MKAASITLGFTVFRPETVPFAARAMHGHDLVVLEEPVTPGFEEMLKGELAIDEYLMLTDFEFPEYARLQCQALKELFAGGAEVLQVHPWMDELVAIHEFLAAGNGPGDIPRHGTAWPVYSREREWTGKLLDFYQASAESDFQKTLQSVLEFARIDAEKIRDMDAARVKAVVRAAQGRSKVYVECGVIHQLMVGSCLRAFGRERVRTLYLMEDVCKDRYGVRRLLPPGDVLTLMYLHRAPRDSRRELLLAARSLIYSRLMEKEEIFECASRFPHLDTEAAVLALVGSMDLSQCRSLFKKLRHAGTKEALALLRRSGH